VYYPLLR